MLKWLRAFILVAVFISSYVFIQDLFASGLDQRLSQAAAPYIKYFQDRALDSTPNFDGRIFQGLTRSFQLYLSGQNIDDERMINYGAASYDQSILSRISLSADTRTILDTYVSYATAQNLNDVNNPLINCGNNYYGASGSPIRYGLFRVARISGRYSGWWTENWDWVVDTGASACFIIDALEAYQKTSNAAYKDFAVLLGNYILELKDTDGGIRAGPRGMHHDSGNDFYWKLKSTEQNERCLYAFDALYAVTNDGQYSQASAGIKSWLKSMYNKQEHLFYCAATFIDPNWVKSEIHDYLATDVTAFAPLKMMFEDLYFGDTQKKRDTEVENMFKAIEGKTGFLDANNRPLFFRFTTSQVPDPIKGDYGSVEWSAQMALAYLRAAQIYAMIDWNKTQIYLDKYNVLITSLETFFSSASDDTNSKVAPYASYYSDKSVAWGVPTGTGYYTFNCQAALASVYYAFAKAGYDPTKLGGGQGIPGNSLNLSLPYYQNSGSYNSTGAVVARMILNFIRLAAGADTLTQDAIYQYAKSGQSLGSELNPDEMAKVLGHFDPYDLLISNWSNSYDSLPGGNPYKGYNFTVDTYDPGLNPEAINEYMRDICHWMAYTVTQEDWWLNGELVAEPNTPAALPIYGAYDHWVAVKGFSASANPCPDPHTNPFNTPNFTVNGFWIKDPLTSGIGEETYKTAAECSLTYFLPLDTTDNYRGKFVQVAEPPPQLSKAKVQIPQPKPDQANLEFIGAKTDIAAAQTKSLSVSASLEAKKSKPIISKHNWRDILPAEALSDAECLAAFNGTKNDKPILVKRADLKNSFYYLIPFNKSDKKGRYLTWGVIMIDAQSGYFKEASWTKTPEKFLKVSGKEAIRILENYIVKEWLVKLNSLLKNRRNSNYFLKTSLLKKDYVKLIGYVKNAQLKLLWETNSPYSSSPYQPYWQVNANGYIWYITQEGGVISETGINKVIAEIETNRNILDRF